MNLAHKIRRAPTTVYVDEVSKEPVVLSLDEGYTALFYEFHDVVQAELYKDDKLVGSKNLYPDYFYHTTAEKVFNAEAGRMVYRHKEEG